MHQALQGPSHCSLSPLWVMTSTSSQALLKLALESVSWWGRHYCLTAFPAGHSQGHWVNLQLSGSLKKNLSWGTGVALEKVLIGPVYNAVGDLEEFVLGVIKKWAHYSNGEAQAERDPPVPDLPAVGGGGPSEPGKCQNLRFLRSQILCNLSVPPRAEASGPHILSWISRLRVSGFPLSDFPG